jgi:UDP-2-acetamido-2-deoxy-ribo-hexuluronate aminotransferase
MNLHIVLDVNVVLDMLLKRPPAANEKARLFSEFKKSGAIFYVAVCALPSLEYIHAREIARLIKEGNLRTEMSPRVFAKKQLDIFLEKIHILSSPGFTWSEIPADHPDREDALIGLSAGLLPEPVYLWTNDGDFDPVAKGVTVINEVSGAALLNKEETPSLSFIDLLSQQTRIRNPLEKRILTVMRHGQYIMGPEIKQLEHQLATYTGVKHCITCASGTDAPHGPDGT